MKPLLLFLLFLLLCACYYPKPAQYSNYSSGIVPFHYQGSAIYCQEASLFMVAEYYADRIGWYDSSFIQSTEDATDNYIYNYLVNNGGKTWYPYSQESAPVSYSSFLYWHLDTYITDSAYLNTHTSGDTAIAWQLQNFQNGCGPLIALFQWSTGETHAVVEYAIRYDNYNQNINMVYYNDPYYGETQKEPPDRWKLHTWLNSGYYLTMNFNNLYKGVKNESPIE